MTEEPNFVDLKLHDAVERFLVNSIGKNRENLEKAKKHLNNIENTL